MIFYFIYYIYFKILCNNNKVNILLNKMISLKMLFTAEKTICLNNQNYIFINNNFSNCIFVYFGVLFLLRYFTSFSFNRWRTDMCETWHFLAKVRVDDPILLIALLTISLFFLSLKIRGLPSLISLTGPCWW